MLYIFDIPYTSLLNIYYHQILLKHTKYGKFPVIYNNYLFIHFHIVFTQKILSNRVVDTNRRFEYRLRQYFAMKFKITTCGYAMEDKIVGRGTKTAAVLYVPKEWEGKKVRIILEEPLDKVE